MQESADGVAQGLVLGGELNFADAQLPVGSSGGLAGGSTQQVLAGEFAVGSTPVAGILGSGLNFLGTGATAFALGSMGNTLGQGFGADPALQRFKPADHPKMIAVLPACPVDIAAILGHEVKHAQVIAQFRQNVGEPVPGQGEETFRSDQVAGKPVAQT